MAIRLMEAVTVEPHDPAKKIIFAEERTLLADIFAGAHAAIEHVGSTAVPGLGGKPVVDIMIGLRSLDEVTARLKPIAAADYLYMPEYEAEIPDRRFFRKPHEGPRECHLHCVLEDSDFFREHIEFRDYLRNDPHAAREYYELKVRLADTLGADRNAYTNAKTDFILNALKLARQKH